VSKYGGEKVPIEIFDNRIFQNIKGIIKKYKTAGKCLQKNQ
jgi:hypothetical protein